MKWAGFRISCPPHNTIVTLGRFRALLDREGNDVGEIAAHSLLDVISNGHDITVVNDLATLKIDVDAELLIHDAFAVHLVDDLLEILGCHTDRIDGLQPDFFLRLGDDKLLLCAIDLDSHQ